jgi:hypothetical protein
MRPSKHAKNAAAALQQVLHISPSDFNAEGSTTVIEQAIRKATSERGGRYPHSERTDRADHRQRPSVSHRIGGCGTQPLGATIPYEARVARLNYHAGKNTWREFC